MKIHRTRRRRDPEVVLLSGARATPERRPGDLERPREDPGRYPGGQGMGGDGRRECTLYNIIVIIIYIILYYIYIFLM
jgi:hypothetical protein